MSFSSQRPSFSSVADGSDTTSIQGRDSALSLVRGSESTGGGHGLMETSHGDPGGTELGRDSVASLNSNNSANTSPTARSSLLSVISASLTTPLQGPGSPTWSPHNSTRMSLSSLGTDERESGAGVIGRGGEDARIGTRSVSTGAGDLPPTGSTGGEGEAGEDGLGGTMSAEELLANLAKYTKLATRGASGGIEGEGGDTSVSMEEMEGAHDGDEDSKSLSTQSVDKKDVVSEQDQQQLDARDGNDDEALLTTTSPPLIEHTSSTNSTLTLPLQTPNSTTLVQDHQGATYSTLSFNIDKDVLFTACCEVITNNTNYTNPPGMSLPLLSSFL